MLQQALYSYTPTLNTLTFKALITSFAAINGHSLAGNYVHLSTQRVKVGEQTSVQKKFGTLRPFILYNSI